MKRHKTPKKPEPTQAPMEVLLKHYHDRLEAYNEATVAFCAERKIDAEERLLHPIDGSKVERADLVKMIRRQHVRLGDTIRERSIELLLVKKLDDEGNIVLDSDGRLVGLSYQEILDILAEEHPYASTSAACLRWYIVQVQEDVDDDGELMYEFPEYRPRSSPKRKRKED